MSDSEKLQQWLLYTPHGRYTLRNERLFYHNSVQNVFGYYSLQIGLAQVNFLQGNKIPSHYVLGDDLKCDLRFLPFDSNSVDLIVCPHALEFTDNYHHVLEECQRILIPGGKLILTGFNHDCFFGRFAKQPEILKSAKPLNLTTLKQQLQDLNFRISGGKFFGYRPFLNNAKCLSRLTWMDKAGDRWFPTYANNFGLTAIKEVVLPTPIMPPNQSFSPEFNPVLGTARICNKK